MGARPTGTETLDPLTFFYSFPKSFQGFAGNHVICILFCQAQNAVLPTFSKGFGKPCDLLFFCQAQNA